MIGISSYGFHFPKYRLARDLIAKATNVRSIGGEKTVANYDEDTLTMAVEASLDCLDGRQFPSPGGLFFCSNTSPYKEKQGATLISAVLDLDQESLLSDFSASLRSSTIALKMATDIIKSKSVSSILIVSSEVRIAEPGSELDQILGDGAAALLISDSNVIATIEASHSVSDEFVDVWRKDDDIFVRSADSGFARNYGYARSVKAAVLGLLNKMNLKPPEVSTLILNSPDSYSHLKLAKELGFNPEEQLQTLLVNEIGNCGVADPFIALEYALETAKPGDKILLVSYGNGSDAILFQVTDEISKIKSDRKLTAQLGEKRMLSTYEKYLKFRNILGESSYTPFSSIPLIWRERRQNYGLFASKCRRCSKVYFPKRRVCPVCKTKDEMEEKKLLKNGKVFTFTKDYVYINPDPPLIVAAVDLDGGGRFFGQVTDCDPGEIKIDLPVRLTFRKLHEGVDVRNYFWKITPLRQKGEIEHGH